MEVEAIKDHLVPQLAGGRTSRVAVEVHIFNNFYFSFLTKIQEWIEHSTTAIKILI